MMLYVEVNTAEVKIINKTKSVTNILSRDLLVADHDYQYGQLCALFGQSIHSATANLHLYRYIVVESAYIALRNLGCT